MFPEQLKQNYPTVTKFLTNAIQKSQIAHSYVMIGNCIEDIVQLALEMSKILNCKENNAPCNKCLNCKWLNENKHPHALNIIKPDETSKKEQIKVEQIRELLNHLTISSEFYRVIFFEKATLNTLTPECCNILLKTIEEASSNTLFIFANPIKEDILPTILSRSQILSLIRNNTGSITNTKHNIPENLFISPKNEICKKTTEIINYIEENNLSFKNYLLNTAIQSYFAMKEANTKQYCTLYRKLSDTYIKSKAFMNTKNIIEDICIS